MTHPETQQFDKDVLNHMRNRLSDYQEKYGDLYNLEATPAESTTYRFAKHDREIYPDIITANMNGTPYYTNSTHLPVGYSEDIFSALDIQDELQTLYTSGTVFHGFLGEKLPDWHSAMSLVRKIAENYRLPYYTLSPTYSICTEHGYLTGEQAICPYCGKPTEVYSRITGYYRAVQNWNDGKAQEFRDRRTYDIGHSRLTHNGPKPETATVATPQDDVPLVPEEPYEESPAEDFCPSCQISFESTDEPSEQTDEQTVEQNEQATQEQPATKDKVEQMEIGLTLITTKTCPKCQLLKKYMEDHNIPYNQMYAEDNMDFVQSEQITQVPTIITPDGRVITGLTDALAYLK